MLYLNTTSQCPLASYAYSNVPYFENKVGTVQVSVIKPDGKDPAVKFYDSVASGKFAEFMKEDMKTPAVTLIGRIFDWLIGHDPTPKQEENEQLDKKENLDDELSRKQAAHYIIQGTYCAFRKLEQSLKGETQIDFLCLPYISHQDFQENLRKRMF